MMGFPGCCHRVMAALGLAPFISLSADTPRSRRADDRNPRNPYIAAPPPTGMVSVMIERTGERLEREHDGPIGDLLAALDVNPETIVVVKNGEVVSEAERCRGEDELRLLSVISGG